MENLELSKYVRIVERACDFAVYHSLFGQLCLIDKDGLLFLKSFQSPMTAEEAKSKFADYDSKKLEAYIQNFISRYFLIPEGYEEYEIMQRDMDYRRQNASEGYLIRALQLVMSNTCNFKCKYCFVDSMYDSPQRTEHQHSELNKTMSFEVAKEAMDKLIALLRKNGHQYLNVEFFGGEPLTNWDTIKYILNTFGNGTKGEVEILYSITTNGSLITEEMSKIFKKYGVAVVISFDSPKSTDRVRLDGKSALELLIPKLEILKNDGNWVAFNSVISKETIGSYDSKGLVDFANQYGISMIGLILDLDIEFYSEACNKAEVIDRLWETYSLSVSQGIPVAGYWHQIFNQIIGKQALLFDSGYKTCPATGCKLSVEPEGHVYICKCCSGYIGDIRDFQKVLTSQKYLDYAMRTYRNSPGCEGCEIDGFCSGICMGALEKKYKSLYGKEVSSCEIYKEITRKLIANVDEKEVKSLYMAELA
jgi:uncharacterized protein